MKIILFLLSILPLCATPDGYEYHADTFFGQNDTSYAVIRHIYVNKGSYYSHEKRAEFREYSKADNSFLKKYDIFTQDTVAYLDSPGVDSLVRSHNKDFNLSKKYEEYNTISSIRYSISSDELSLSTYGLIYKNINLSNSLTKEANKLLALDSKYIKAENFRLFKHCGIYYIEKRNLQDNEDLRKSYTLYLALPEGASRSLSYVEHKEEIYLARSFHKTEEDAFNKLKVIDDKERDQYKVYKIKSLPKPHEGNSYCIMVNDAPDILKKMTLTQWKETNGSSLIPVLSSHVEHPLNQLPLEPDF